MKPWDANFAWGFVLGNALGAFLATAVMVLLVVFLMAE